MCSPTLQKTVKAAVEPVRTNYRLLTDLDFVDEVRHPRPGASRRTDHPFWLDRAPTC